MRFVVVVPFLCLFECLCSCFNVLFVCLSLLLFPRSLCLFFCVFVVCVLCVCFFLFCFVFVYVVVVLVWFLCSSLFPRFVFFAMFV